VEGCTEIDKEITEEGQVAGCTKRDNETTVEGQEAAILRGIMKVQ